MDPGAAHVHREEGLDEEAAARASPRGRTSCCKKSSAPSWRPTTSRSSATTPTASAPDAGCHTALTAIQRRGPATTWFIEGDISKCFDSLDHAVLLAILREKIHDSRFLRLIENLLKAGYLEDWKYGHTLSGTPQGGVVSPILANIYLDRLDQFVEQVLIPEYNRGTARKPNKAVPTA